MHIIVTETNIKKNIQHKLIPIQNTVLIVNIDIQLETQDGPISSIAAPPGK